MVGPTISIPDDWYCKKHATQYRELNNAPPMQVWMGIMASLIVHDKRIIARCGGDINPNSWDSTNTVSIILGEVGPFCCFLPPAALAFSFALALKNNPEKEW